MRSMLVFLTAIGVLVTIPAFAQVGPEFQVNTYTTDNQSAPSVGANAEGDFVVVWSSYGQDGASFAVFGQRFDASGLPQGSEFQVNTYTTNKQYFPSVALDADGDFVVVWNSESQDGSRLGVFGQRFDNTGSKVGSEFQVNTFTSSYQKFPSVGMDADGDFVVTWFSRDQDGSSDGVFGQRFDASGVAQGSEFQVNTFTSSSQYRPSVAMDADGDFVVVWGSDGQDGSSWGVFGQRFDKAGSKMGSEFQVNTFTSSDEALPSVAMNADGDFVVAWQSYAQGRGVFGQRFDASGVPQESEFQVNTETIYPKAEPRVAMAADGEFVVAWYSRGPDGSGAGVFGRRFNASGLPQGSEFQVNTHTTLDQQRPSVGMDADGGFVMAWQSSTQDGSNWGVFAAQSPKRAELTITKTADRDRAFAGGEIIYTIQVSNAGPDDATDVSIEDRLPAGLEYLSGATSQGAGCSESDGTVLCDLGTLPVGNTATVTIAARVVEAFENTASVRSPEFAGSGATATTSTVLGIGSNVPALDEWALIALVLLLAMAGFVALRR